MATNDFKILVIDDSITNVVLLNAILSESGYATKTAFDAGDALKMLNKDIPDLILLDLQMPVISGFDFLKNIRSEKKYAGISVLVVTAYSDEENINRALDLGADDYIEKPIDIDRLLEKIRDFSKQKIC